LVAAGVTTFKRVRYGARTGRANSFCRAGRLRSEVQICARRYFPSRGLRGLKMSGRNQASGEMRARVLEFLGTYGDSRAGAAHLLCDQYRASAPAFALIASDLTSRE